jgi:ribosomal protein L37AE/L43A
MGNWEDATKGLPVATCPRCQEQRRVERINAEYFCQSCAKSWPIVGVVAPKEK